MSVLVIAVNPDGSETVPIETTSLGSLDEAMRLMYTKAFRRVEIRNNSGVVLSYWTLISGRWVRG